MEEKPDNARALFDPGQCHPSRGRFDTCLATAAVISFKGTVGVIGLLVRHIARLAIGSGERDLIPASALLGACLRLAPDIVAKTVAAPVLPPRGAITARRDHRAARRSAADLHAATAARDWSERVIGQEYVPVGRWAPIPGGGSLGTVIIGVVDHRDARRVQERRSEWGAKAAPRVESAGRTPDGGRVWLRPLVVFLVLSFGLTWGIAAAFMLFTEALVAVLCEKGSTNLLFILAVYAPAMAGLFVVWRLHGVRGVAGFVRRLTLWRMPAVWWGVLIVGVPAVYFLAATIGGTMNEAFPFSPWYSVLPLLALALVLGPVEELGWRGVALPLRQRRLAPLWAGTVLGVTWIVWLMPAFFIGGTPQSEFAFAWFYFGGLGISIVMTAMFDAARGSLLVMALFHWQINDPIWPEAGGWAALLEAERWLERSDASRTAPSEGETA